MPYKKLPSNPSLDHLKYQAKDLRKAHADQDPEALQRLREFLPQFRGATDPEIASAPLSLSDAQLAIAREYCFASWPRLQAHVRKPPAGDGDRPHHERIEDPTFRHAVELIDSGDEDGLRSYLAENPGLARQRVFFDIGDYFGQPSLLEFVAENPIRHGSLSPNVVRVAQVLLAAGATRIDATLGLVCSGKVPRECGVQVPLIDLLCDAGADPNRSMLGALGHGEFEAVEALVHHGARVDLPVAAATGRADEARALIAGSSAEERHLALALAARFGVVEVVRMLLDAGEDPSRYNPMGVHSHSTPLHQAALYGQEEVVRLLIEHGARRDLKDVIFHGTPLEWAEHGGQERIVALLTCVPPH